MFAKLFDTAQGQSLVQLLQDDDGRPLFKYSFENVHPDLDVVDVAITMGENSDEGWAKATRKLHEIDIDIVNHVRERITKSFINTEAIPMPDEIPVEPDDRSLEGWANVIMSSSPNEGEE